MTDSHKIVFAKTLTYFTRDLVSYIHRNSFLKKINYSWPVPCIKFFLLCLFNLLKFGKSWGTGVLGYTVFTYCEMTLSIVSMIPPEKWF
jgi:hypothetical protein